MIFDEEKEDQPKDSSATNVATLKSVAHPTEFGITIGDLICHLATASGTACLGCSRREQVRGKVSKYLAATAQVSAV